MGENNGNHNMISACGLLTNGCTSAAAMAMAAAANGSLSPTSFLVQQQQQQNSSNSSTTSSASSSTAQSQQQFSADYLSQLLKDKKQLTAFPNMFMHLERLVDEEIAKVRSALFHLESSNKEALVLPDASGNVITVQEKVYVPVKEFPDYNFVGRILGPRGMTAKQLEQETNCKIMVRGKGSMRDKKKEEQNRGKPNWEHLTDELHVLIQCEDTENRAKVKIQRAIDEVKRLLVPAPEGEDDLKRKQLMELAIINGTYRPSNQKQIALQFFPENPRLLTPMSLTSPLRSPSLGAPIILSPNRLNNHNAAAQAAAANHAAAQQNALTNQMNNFQALSSLMPGAGADFQAAAAAAGLLYNFQVDPMASFQAAYPYSAAHAALTSPLLAGEYPGLDAQAGAILNQRRILAQAREHPYQRASLKTPTS